MAEAHTSEREASRAEVMAMNFISNVVLVGELQEREIRLLEMIERCRWEEEQERETVFL